MALTIPNEYGYVLTVASTTFLLNFWQGILVSRARKAAQIKYPTPYATEERAERDPAAFRFNCAQRAHANLQENLTPFLGGLLIAGLRHPKPAAALGAVWVASRALYALRYVAYGPAGRGLTFPFSLAAGMALKGMALWTSVSMAMAA